MLKYTDLSEFTKAYVDALFFTENEETREKDFSDFTPDAITKIVTDCAIFELTNTNLLNKAYALKDDYTVASAGHDFWLTRNGHGAGFWDRGLNYTGEKLTDSCQAFPECNVFVGDDGSLYF